MNDELRIKLKAFKINEKDMCNPVMDENSEIEIIYYGSGSSFSILTDNKDISFSVDKSQLNEALLFTSKIVSSEIKELRKEINLLRLKLNEKHD